MSIDSPKPSALDSSNRTLSTLFVLLVLRAGRTPFSVAVFRCLDDFMYIYIYTNMPDGLHMFLFI